MIIKENTSLLPYNTFGIDINTKYFIEYSNVTELEVVLKSKIVKLNRLLAMGSGSNLLFLNDFKGAVIHSAIHSIDIKREDAESVYLEVGSGMNWDELVSYCVEKGWGGIENLSLIPGEVGAAAVQNIGAYGVELKDSIVEVKTVKISTGIPKTFTQKACKYGYRDSIFKNKLKNKYLITSVVFRLDKQQVFHLNYQNLEEAVNHNGDVTLQNIRQTIIAIRKLKLPDPKVQGNAGSFFMNPVIPTEQFLTLQVKYPLIPHYFVSDTEEKIPAAWLIDQCGWKGRQIGNAGVHDKQALVLINCGGATGKEIFFLAEQIQASVKLTFGIDLHPEVNFIH